MFGRFLINSRYMLVIAVVGSLIASLGLLVFGFIKIFLLVTGYFQLGLKDSETPKYLVYGVAQLMDFFILAAVLYIIAVGLYELFIDPDLPAPAWLVIRNLDDLKERLLAALFVVMVVIFLGYLIEWDGSNGIFWVGAAIALVLAPVAYLITTGVKSHPDIPQASAGEPHGDDR